MNADWPESPRVGWRCAGNRRPGSIHPRAFAAPGWEVGGGERGCVGRNRGRASTSAPLRPRWIGPPRVRPAMRVQDGRRRCSGAPRFQPTRGGRPSVETRFEGQSNKGRIVDLDFRVQETATNVATVQIFRPRTGIVRLNKNHSRIANDDCNRHSAVHRCVRSPRQRPNKRRVAFNRLTQIQRFAGR